LLENEGWGLGGGLEGSLAGIAGKSDS